MAIKTLEYHCPHCNRKLSSVPQNDYCAIGGQYYGEPIETCRKCKKNYRRPPCNGSGAEPDPAAASAVLADRCADDGNVDKSGGFQRCVRHAGGITAGAASDRRGLFASLRWDAKASADA